MKPISNSPRGKLFAGIVLGVILVACIAGVKVSRMTRTTTFQSNSLFIVVTGTTTKITRHVQAHDLARGLGPWITNSGAGGGVASNAIANASGRGTNTTLYGTTQLGDADGAGTTTVSNAFFGRSSILTPNLTVSSAATISGSLEVQGLGTGRRATFLDQNHILKAASDVDDTELDYLDGVTSPIQTQLTDLYNRAFTNANQIYSNVFVVNPSATSASVLSNLFRNGSSTNVTIRLGAGTFFVPPVLNTATRETNAALALRNKTNWVVEGQGDNTIIYSPSNGLVLGIADCDNITFRNLRFDGDAFGHSSNGVPYIASHVAIFNTNRNINFENILFTDIPVICIAMFQDAGDHNTHMTFRNIQGFNYGCTNLAVVGADGCLIGGGADNVQISGFRSSHGMRTIEMFTISGGQSFTNISISDGLVDNPGIDAVMVQGNNKGVLINNVSVWQTTNFLGNPSTACQAFILAGGVADALVSNCKVFGVQGLAYALLDSAGGISNVTFQSCTAMNAGLAGVGGGGFIINDASGGAGLGIIDGVKILGCTVAGTIAGGGVDIYGGRNISIVDSDFIDIGGGVDAFRDCVRIYATGDPTTNVVIRNNRMWNNPSTVNKANYGVNVGANAKGVTYHGQLPRDMVIANFTNAAGTEFTLIIDYALAAGSNVTLSTNNSTRTVTIASTGGGAGGPTTSNNIPFTAYSMVTGSPTTNIVIDASLGTLFRVLLTNSIAGLLITNGVDGQELSIELFQDGTGNRTVTHVPNVGGAQTNNWQFGEDITSPITLTTNQYKKDLLKLRYEVLNLATNTSRSNWMVIGTLRKYPN